MNVIYTTADGLYRVVEKSGTFYPQMNLGGVWHYFYGGYEQFSTRYHNKSHKTESGCKKFVNGWSAATAEDGWMPDSHGSMSEGQVFSLKQA